MTYEELIKDIIWVKTDDGDRISYSKVIGVIIFLLYFLSLLINAPSMVRNGFSFAIFVFITFIVGLFWYGVCRGIGFLARKIGIR